MKKIFAFVCISYALCSCINEEMDDFVENGRGVRIPFVGEFAEMTKFQFSDAVDGIHGTTWSEGDAIGIFSYDMSETMNENIKAVLHERSVGESSGIFIPQEDVLQIPSYEEGTESSEEIIKISYPKYSSEEWVVYYPYKSGTTISVDDGCIHSTLSPDQFQETLGDRKVCQNGIATALAIMEAGAESATFALSHQLAYICVEATSTEFTGYQLHGVQMFDKKGEAALVGDYAIDPISGVLTPKEGSTKSTVRVDVKNHDFASTPAKSELYLTVLPGDFSSADMYFVVTFKNSYGESKTVPVKFDKRCKFPAGSITSIDLGNITESMASEWPWYEVSEKRDLLGKWAYGSQNTYMAMKPWQDPTEGAPAVAANEIIIDVKPRGDFYRVREPKYWAILSSAEMGDTSKGASRRLVSIDGTSTIAATATPLNINQVEGFTPAGSYVPINADYTFKVYILPTSDRLITDPEDPKYLTDRKGKDGRWATVAIFDADYNLIWSYMINSYDEDDAPKAVQYPGYALMDRFLGVGNGNEKAAREGWFDCNSPAYFQWGRKDPLNYSSTQGLATLMTFTKEQVDDIGDAASMPTTRIATGGNTWYKGEIRHDLWGGSASAVSGYDPDARGHKTIYDPCPEGYRIPDPKVFKDLLEKAEIWEFDASLAGINIAIQVKDPSSPDYRINPNSPWASPIPYESNRNSSVFAYPLGGGQYDYWPYLGYIGHPDQYSSGGYQYSTGRSSSTHMHGLCAWANTTAKAEGCATCFEYILANYKIVRQTERSITAGYPVRCQKED